MAGRVGNPELRANGGNISTIEETGKTRDIAAAKAVLGWHDSFIVQKSREADLVEAMKAAYREIINREPPAIK